MLMVFERLKKKILPYALAAAAAFPAFAAGTPQTTPSSPPANACTSRLPNLIYVRGADKTALLPAVEQRLGKDFPDERVGTIVFNLPGAGPIDPNKLPPNAEVLIHIGLVPDGFKPEDMRVYWNDHGSMINTTGQVVQTYALPFKDVKPLIQQACQDVYASHAQPTSGEARFYQNLERLVLKFSETLTQENRQMRNALHRLAERQDKLETRLTLAIDQHTREVIAYVNGNVSYIIGTLTDFQAMNEEELNKIVHDLRGIYARLDQQDAQLTMLQQGQQDIRRQIHEGYATLERKIEENKWKVSVTLAPMYVAESFNAGSRIGWSLGGRLTLTTRGWGLGVDGSFSQTNGSGAWNENVTATQVTPYVTVSLGRGKTGDLWVWAGPTFQWGSEHLEKQKGSVLVEAESNVSLLGGSLGVKWNSDTVEGGLDIGYLPFGTSSSTTRVNGETVDTASGNPSAWSVSAHAGGDFGSLGAGLRVKYQQETLDQKTTVSSIQIGPYIKFGR